jgi:hypothetical protein
LFRGQTSSNQSWREKAVVIIQPLVAAAMAVKLIEIFSRTRFSLIFVSVELFPTISPLLKKINN